jgi:hypothetical protein
MTPIRRRLMARPSLAHGLSFLAVMIAIASAVLVVVLHYNENARQTKAKSDSSISELHRLQDAFCGTAAKPGLLRIIANSPINSQTTPLGRTFIVSSQRAAAVIHCPTPKGTK